MQSNSDSQLPWEIDGSQVNRPGRKPCQLKGSTYNVPSRRQVSVSLLLSDIDKIDFISKKRNVARSKIISELINTHPAISKMQIE